jgi:glucose-6-phosphate 1-epimerase
MVAAALSEHHGQAAVKLRAPCGARATVLLHGAHLVSWTPPGGEEQLFLSETAIYGPGASIRGGVPVIFPQFNQRGPLPRHGLVRTRPWTLIESVVRGGCAIAVLGFASNEETLAIWPHQFELELTVSIGERELEIELAVVNTGAEAFDFQAALHTYLRCNDALKLQLEGLQGCAYEDALAAQAPAEPLQQWGDVLTVVGPVDRVYHGLRRNLILRELGRKVDIGMRGFGDAVVWNPGEAANAKMADLPPGDWQRMLCVEAAAIVVPPRLQAGEEWAGSQRLRA